MTVFDCTACLSSGFPGWAELLAFVIPLGFIVYHWYQENKA